MLPAQPSAVPQPGSATTLPGRLLLVLLVALLPLLAYAIVAAEATRHASLDWLEVELQDAARQAAMREAEVLGEADRFLRALAAAPMPAAGPRALCADLQPALAGAPAAVAALAVHFPDAGTACVVTAPHGRGMATAFGAGHVRAALAGGTAITADPQAGLVLSYALASGGGVQAVLALALAPDHLPPLSLPLHREQAVRMLVDPDDGTVLAAAPDHLGRAGLPIAFPRVLAALRAGAADGAVVGRDSQGVRRLVGHAALPVPEGGGLAARAVLLIDLPYEPLLAEADARRNEQWLIVLALALVGAAAAWLLARRALVRPIRALMARLPGHSLPQAQMLATLRPAAAWLRQQGDLAAVADASAEMFLRLDGTLRVIYASPATRRVLGYAPSEVVDADLAAEPGWEACQTLLAALRGGALRVEPCEIVARRRDDREARLEVRATRLGDGGFLLACRDIGAEHALRQELDEARQRLAALALSDRQTGLANRHRFDEVLMQELGRARRSQEPITLVLLRLSDWSAFVDRHGGAVAEDALRRLGGLLSGTLRRPGDLAARMEGDLFGVLLPTTDRIGAQRVAERLFEALAAEWGAAGEPVPVAHVGACSVLPLGEEDTAEALLDLAHGALREAEAGRGVALVTPLPVPVAAGPVGALPVGALPG